MPKANGVDITQPTRTSKIHEPDTISLAATVDAFSASPAIRLRFKFFKARATMPAPLLPPPVGIPRSGREWDPTVAAKDDKHPLAHLMRLRDEAAAQVERLLHFLDETDGLDDREPDLGFSDGCDDREAEPEHDEDAQEDEPWLGSCNPTPGGSQIKWSGDPGSPTDGREDDGSDLEPSLCGITFDRGSDHDLEESCEGEGELDSGIGDYDGLLEQDPARFAHCDVRVDP